MTILQFSFRNARFFLRKNIWLILTIALTTAIITGALLIGSAIKGSLRRIASEHIGEVEDVVMLNSSWLRDSVVSKIEAQSAAIIHVVGYITQESGVPLKVNIYGVDSDFFKFVYNANLDVSLDVSFLDDKNSTKVLINNRILVDDSDIVVRTFDFSDFSQNLSWSLEDNALIGLRLEVESLGDNAEKFLNFQLENSQTDSANIFVSRRYLARKINRENFVNLLLLKGYNSSKKLFDEDLELEDYKLTLTEIDEKIVELTSKEVFIESSISQKLLDLNEVKEGIFSYFVNEIEHENCTTPYSFIAGLSTLKIAENECVVTQWLADDLNLKIGDKIGISYYNIESSGKLTTSNSTLIVQNIIANEKRPDLMPKISGFSDSESCNDWDPSIPVDTDKIRDKDEEYWNSYGGSPKLYTSLDTAQKLFGSKFGNLTSVRFEKQELDRLRSKISSCLLQSNANFTPINIAQISKIGVEKSVDFSSLFLALSAFVIVSGVILLYLVASLNLERRKKEFTLLKSVGFSNQNISQLLCVEFMLYLIIGGGAGGLLGVGYAKVILLLLNSVWGVVSNYARVDFYMDFSAVAIGVFSSVIIAFATMFWALRKAKKSTVHIFKTGKKIFWYIAIILTIGIFLYGLLVEQQIVLFFVSSFLMMFVLLKGLKYLLCLSCNYFTASRLTLFGLAIRNNLRNMGRTMASVAILSFGLFLTLLTTLNYTTATDSNDLKSGTGGFLGYFELFLPIQHDLNSTVGREKYRLEGIPETFKFYQLKSISGADAGCLNLNRVSRPRLLALPEKMFDNRFSFSAKDDSWQLLEQETSDPLTIPVIADSEVIMWSLGAKIGDKIDYMANGINYKLWFVAGLQKSIFQGSVLISEKNLKKLYPNETRTQMILIENATPQELKTIARGLERYGALFRNCADRLNEFNAVQNNYLMIFFALGAIGLIVGTVGFALVIYENFTSRRRELSWLLSAGYSKMELLKLVFMENLFIFSSAIVISILSLLFSIIPLALFSANHTPPYLIMGVVTLFIVASGIIIIWSATQKIVNSLTIKSLRSE